MASKCKSSQFSLFFLVLVCFAYVRCLYPAPRNLRAQYLPHHGVIRVQWEDELGYPSDVYRLLITKGSSQSMKTTVSTAYDITSPDSMYRFLLYGYSTRLEEFSELSNGITFRAASSNTRPINVNVSCTKNRDVYVTWDAPYVRTVKHYVVSYRSITIANTTTETMQSTQTSLVIRNLTSSTTYSLHVYAVGSDASFGALSKEYIFIPDCSLKPDTDIGMQICNNDKFFCRKKNSCIPGSWVCDYDDDCGDGSDEQNCPLTNGLEKANLIRLTHGGVPWKGRLEVYYEGQWGTVCDDGFGHNEAVAVCNQLGFYLSRSEPYKMSGRRGGSGLVWLDNIKCPNRSSHAYLWQCKSLPWGSIRFCGYHENVYVNCFQDPYSIPRLEYSINGSPHAFLEDETSIGVKENGSLLLSMDTDVNSDPIARVKLFNEQGLIEGDGTELLSISLNQIQCQQTGRYVLEAFNLHNIERPVQRRFRLDVHCIPRAQSQESLREFAGKRNEKVIFSATVIADPPPTVAWNKIVQTLPVVKDNEYTYRVGGSVYIRGDDDYGTYTVTLRNRQGELSLAFIIRPGGVPDVPANFTMSDIQESKVNLTWISMFNGGSQQTFGVDIEDPNSPSAWRKVEHEIPDPGRNTLVYLIVEDLEPGTHYTYRLFSSNSDGSSNMTYLSLTTKGKGNIELIVGITVGSVILLVVIVVVSIITWKHKKDRGVRDSRNEEDHQYDLPVHNRNNKARTGGQNDVDVYENTEF